MKRTATSGEATDTTYYAYDACGDIWAEVDETGEVEARYIRDQAGRVLAIERGQVLLHLLYNTHGDVVALVDGQGNTVATYEYDEFGNMTGMTGIVKNPLRYSGANNAFYDEDTDMYRMGMRYYLPEIGRFIQRDLYDGEDDAPQSQNGYVYAQNNPVSKVDPTGLMPAWATKWKSYRWNTRRVRESLSKFTRNYGRKLYRGYWINDRRLGRVRMYYRFSCSAFALKMISQYAKKYKLRLRIDSGESHYDSREFGNADSYYTTLRRNVFAKDIADKNSVSLDRNENGRGGDLLCYGDPWHVQVIAENREYLKRRGLLPKFMVYEGNLWTVSVAGWHHSFPTPVGRKYKTYNFVTRNAYGRKPRRWDWIRYR